MGPDPLCRFGCGPGWAEGIIKHKFSRIRPVVPMCPYEKARRRNMANTIELSVCCGDAALRQITFTTCSHFLVWTRYGMLSGRFRLHPKSIKFRLQSAYYV